MLIKIQRSKDSPGDGSEICMKGKSRECSQCGDKMRLVLREPFLDHDCVMGWWSCGACGQTDTLKIDSLFL